MIQHLTVLASGDPHAALLAQRLDPHTTIHFTDRNGLADQLLTLSERLPSRPRTLDFVGLTGHDKLLSFHGRPFDTQIKRVRAFFRELSEQQVLSGLGITALRLIGCATAVGDRARRTISTLSEIIELEVQGTQALVSLDDFATTGYETTPTRTWGAGTLLDLDALRPEPLCAGARVLDPQAGRAILGQIRRTAGTALPFLLATPHHELALPSVIAGQYHHLEVLLDYELVRANIRGASVVFPVEDPRALRTLLEA